MGNVIQAGNGQNPARQAALNGGLGEHVAALTINKVCGSGLKAVMLAAQGIATGDIDIAVAGGMESMSNAPYLLPRIREGLRMGNGQLVDSMINDGLWCAFENCHMGLSGETVAEMFKVGRSEQDAYAAESHRKAARPRARVLQGRDPPVSIPQRKGNPVVVDTDEPIREDTTVESLGALKPAFKKDGTVTAGNAPGVNDGAAALVVMAAREGAGARPHAAGADHRPGDERPAAEAGDDDAGRSRPEGGAEDRLGPQGRRPVRDQRGVLGAGCRRHARAGDRSGEGERPRRRRRAGPPDRRVRRARPHDAAVRDETPRRERGIAALCLGGGNGVALAIEM
jgi:acetyl-CoA C-acetyltransferase